MITEDAVLITCGHCMCVGVKKKAMLIKWVYF